MNDIMMDLRSYGFTGVNLENIMHGASVSANRRGQQRRVVFRHQTKALKVPMCQCTCPYCHEKACFCEQAFLLEVDGSVTHTGGRSKGSQSCRHDACNHLQDQFPSFFVFHFLSGLRLIVGVKSLP